MPYSRPMPNASSTPMRKMGDAMHEAAAMDWTGRAFFPRFPHERPEHPPSVVRSWIDRQRQRSALAELDDRLLGDIGITRAEAQREAARWN